MIFRPFSVSFQLGQKELFQKNLQLYLYAFYSVLYTYMQMYEKTKKYIKG
jgi:hypothetical protein